MEPPELSAPDPRLGRLLQGRYRIISKLASGAMGVVYRGERIHLGRPVAVKFLHPWIAAQKAFLGRFENEAKAMSRLAHPNCVSVIDFGVDGTPYLVMDFVTGVTLREAIADRRLPVPRALHIARQLLAGLAHAHAQGIVHRDLKPDNIILSVEAGLEDHLRILDFGLAKLRDGPAMTAGMAIGTPSYMSPEQAGGDGEVDARTDIYSVGVLLFELLTGRKPFRSEHIGDLLLMHREAPIPALRSVAPDVSVSAALEQAVGRALAKRPADRFASAAAFADALEQTPEGRRPAAAPVASAAAGAVPAAGGPDVPSGRALRRREQRWRARLVGGVLLAAGAAALVTGVILRRGPAPAVTSPTVKGAPSASAPVAPARSETGVRHKEGPAVPTPAAPVPSAPSAPAATDDAPASGAPAAATARDAFAAQRWSDALAAAEAAVRANPEWKSDPALIAGAIAALADDKVYPRAQVFLRRLGAAATPALRDAARRHAQPSVRQRSAALLEPAGRGGIFSTSPRPSPSRNGDGASSFFRR